MIENIYAGQEELVQFEKKFLRLPLPLRGYSEQECQENLLGFLRRVESGEENLEWTDRSREQVIEHLRWSLGL